MWVYVGGCAWMYVGVGALMDTHVSTYIRTYIHTYTQNYILHFGASLMLMKQFEAVGTNCLSSVRTHL